MSNVDIQSVLAQIRVMNAKTQGLGLAGGLAKTQEAGQSDFSDLLKKSIDAVNATQKEAGKMSESFSKGDADVNLAQVMIALQKASVSFEAMSQVRNKLVDAYQEIMRMHV